MGRVRKGDLRLPDRESRNVNSHLKTRLGFLRSTIPTAHRRRTVRGRLRTCRELAGHIDRARQLFGFADNDSDAAAVGELIAELERRRAELTDAGTLANHARADRTTRAARQRSSAAEFLRQAEAARRG